jgi:hypothetical protein
MRGPNATTRDDKIIIPHHSPARLDSIEIELREHNITTLVSSRTFRLRYLLSPLSVS